MVSFKTPLDPIERRVSLRFHPESYRGTNPGSRPERNAHVRHCVGRPVSVSVRQLGHGVVGMLPQMSLRLTGSAPSRSSFARSRADVLVKLPLMPAPKSPLIPFGYCLKSMEGTVISWSSSATAKC